MNKITRNVIKCSCKKCGCPEALAISGKQPWFTFTYINEDLKIIYFDVPKAASTSIRKSLFNNNNNLSLTEPVYPLEEYLKFTFVRNPYNRIVSNYTMFTQNKFRIDQIKQFHPNPQSMSFDDFVELIEIHDNHHWRPQVDFLDGYDIDFIGRVENFNADYNSILKKIGQDTTTAPHENRTFHKPYTDFINTKNIERINNIYIKDFKTLGYDYSPYL